MTLRLKDLPESVRARVMAGNLPASVLGRRDVSAMARLRGGKSAAKVRGGRRARASGASLEAAVQAAALAQMAIITLEALPACGARFVGKGRAKAQPICCDFVGCFIGGHGVYFDAKRVGSGRASFAVGDPKIVKPHQRAFLGRMARDGAVAGVLVEHGGVFRWLDGMWLDGMRLLPAIGGTPLPRVLRWEDGRWLVLGTSIDFGKLQDAYSPQRHGGTEDA